MREKDWMEIEPLLNKLDTVAPELNAVRNAMGTVIAKVEARIAKIHLGVPGWVTISACDKPDAPWKKELGYAKWDGKWGLYLRHINSDHVETWRFNDGPAYLRVDAIPKFAELLAHLLDQAEKHLELVQKRTEQLKGMFSLEENE